jgi:hypothetical protein
MENTLLIYKFYNGCVERDASVCNLYEVFRSLNIIVAGEGYSADNHKDTICWVRDYTKGYTIKTQTQLDTLLLNDPKRLRISFFSYPVSSIKGLKLMIETGSLPNIIGKPVYDINVYTLWFDGNALEINKSGITNVDLLFKNVCSAYTQFYFEEETKEEQTESYNILGVATWGKK